MMEIFRTGARLVYLQLAVWVAASLLIFFSTLPMDGFVKSLIYTGINTVFYAMVIYTNILFLYPVFYRKGKIVAYVLLVTIFIIATGLFRGYITVVLYNHFLQGKPREVSLGLLINYIPAGILVYLLSLIFRVAIAYFTLKQQADEMKVQKDRAELDLLKSRVQPHFLFNTLNNIYYEAYLEAPRTAGLIERLSDIMRYFVDEIPKETVDVMTEIAFIENYISLEKIRIRNGADIRFTMEFNADLRIPPMLLMTFVENIFKHGIDKSGGDNKIDMSLTRQGDYLFFKTMNNVVANVQTTQSNGFGLVNLRQRLSILYGSDFELLVNEDKKIFTALLKIPVT